MRQTPYDHCLDTYAREVLSGVFLAAPSSSSSTSALFVGWGLLIGYDLFLNEDNASEPLDIACDDAPLVDVWCPLGSSSEPISFNRSQSETDAEDNGTRSPINYATAYLDLDWLYGRDNESARAIRTLELGYLNVTTAKLPHLLPDGTWLVSGTRLGIETWGRRTGLECLGRWERTKFQADSNRTLRTGNDKCCVDTGIA